MKKALSILFVMSLCLGCFAACGTPPTDDSTATTAGEPTSSTTATPTTPPEPEDTSIKVYYDDITTISDIIGKEVTTYEIKDVVINSKVVGTENPDTKLFTVNEADNTVTATATGSAIIVADGEEYEVKVLPAPITIALIIGHSLGEGSQGNAAQSVKCELGQVYSSYLPDALYKNADETTGLGTTAEKRPKGVDALANGEGRPGAAGGIGYEWTKLTGEKIWVLNAAVGGSCVNEWVEGTAYHINATRMLIGASKVLKNEVAAGHYEYKGTTLLSFSSGNFYYKGVLNSTKSELTNEEIKTWHDSVWNGFQTGMTIDIDGDGKADTPTSLGFVPLWEATGHMNKFNYDKHAIYYMALSDEYPHVYIASHASRSWQTWDGIKSTFPEIDYETQSQPVKAPEKFEDVSADKVHLTQLGYNAQGQEIAQNMYNYLRTENEPKTVLLYNVSGQSISSINVNVGSEYRFALVVNPVSASDITVTCSDNIEIVAPGVVKGKTAGTGKITLSYGEEVIKTITVKVK